MTMAEKFNRTFVLPETFWHYGEDVALDEGVNVQRMISYGGGRPTVARNADFRAVQEQYPDIYNSYKTLPDRPGMGHCDQMENVLSGTACVARSTAHNVHLYCEQQPFGACFPPDAASNFVAAAPIVEKAVNDQVRHLGRYIYFSYSPELPFDAAMQAIEGLETNLTTYDTMVIDDSSGSNELVSAVQQFVDASSLKEFDVYTLDEILKPLTCEKVRGGRGCRLFSSQRNQLVIIGAAYRLSGELIKQLDREKEQASIDQYWKAHRAMNPLKRPEVPVLYDTKDDANVRLEEPSRHGPWAWAYRSPPPPSPFSVNATAVPGLKKSPKNIILTILFFAKDVNTIEGHCRAGKKSSHYETFTQRNIVDDDAKHEYSTVSIVCHFKGSIPDSERYVTVSYGIGMYMGKSITQHFLRSKIWKGPKQESDGRLSPTAAPPVPSVATAAAGPQLTACLPTLFCPVNMEHFDVDYTLEWLRYHGHVAGIEHVYIYSDDRLCAKTLMDAMKKADTLPLRVTVMAMYSHLAYLNETHYHGQTMAMRDCWLRNRAMSVPWTLFMDWDELLEWPARWAGFTWRDKFEGFSAVSIPSWHTEHRTCLPDHTAFQANPSMSSDLGKIVTQGHEKGWPRLARMQLSENVCTTCNQRAKLCNHPGHSYCCTGFCGHRKYAVVPARGVPASIHMPDKSLVSSIDLDTRTGVFIRHLMMPVLDKRSTGSMCMYQAAGTDVSAGHGAGFDSLPVRANLEAPSKVHKKDKGAASPRYYDTKGGAGGPLNKHGKCIYIV